MLILALRTDAPKAMLVLLDDYECIASLEWEAHRALTETIHQKIDALLQSHGKTLEDLQGLIGYRGPGSFTGLRIGLSVANAFSAGLKIPITGATGETWLQDGVNALLDKAPVRPVLPEYGAPVHITQPKR